MTRSLSIAAALVAATLLAAPLARAAEPAKAGKPAATSPDDAMVTIPVTGMTCSGCVDKVTGKLQAVPGVKVVKVDLEGRRARVTYDAKRVTPKALTDAIRDAGYTPGAPAVH